MKRLQEIRDTFLPGRTFQVRDDLVATEVYNTIDVAHEMLRYRGMFVTVDRVEPGRGGRKVYIMIQEDEGEWRWSDDMFVDPYSVYIDPMIDVYEADLFAIIT